jgi:CheY-like chemotaxis protein
MTLTSLTVRNVALMSERLEDLAGQARTGHDPRAGGEGPPGAGPAASPSESHPTPAPASEPATLAALSGIRVLVIDDDDDALQLLAAFLRRHGARVATANSARSGLERRRDFTPDVLLSDLSMPGEDGFWLIERIRDEESRRSTARLPAAAVTALTLDQDRTRALAAGYDLHIPKPVRPDRLTAMVARLAGRPQA